MVHEDNGQFNLLAPCSSFCCIYLLRMLLVMEGSDVCMVCCLYSNDIWLTYTSGDAAE